MHIRLPMFPLRFLLNPTDGHSHRVMQAKNNTKNEPCRSRILVRKVCIFAFRCFPSDFFLTLQMVILTVLCKRRITQKMNHVGVEYWYARYAYSRSDVSPPISS